MHLLLRFCQLGRTIKMTSLRRAFYPPEELVEDVREQVAKVKKTRAPIDYLTFVPDGEPTLDVNLGREIELLRPLGIKIAVITNSSLIWQADVSQSLMLADLVSLKIDSVSEDIWRKVDRPHGALSLASILEGMGEFAQQYRGELVVETMLVRGINDGDDQIHALADFLVKLKPARTYIAIPTRPPAERWVQPPEELVLNRAYQIISRRVNGVEYLIGFEGDAFATTGDVVADLLNITAVHPMREDAVVSFLERARSDWKVISQLMEQGKLIEVAYEGSRFYLRKLYPEKSGTI